MWSYYGSKSKVVDHYPKPKYGVIREPFCGSARYSLKYFENDIKLTDKYEVVVKLWKYLQQCSEKDILKLPKLPIGTVINREDFDCIEQAWLMGFLITNGVSYPMRTVSKWGHVVFEKQRNDIAKNLFKIRHWKIDLCDYVDIPNEVCTWFIDAPYQVGGDKYRHKKIDFKFLSCWTKERMGQVIACENTKADWLPFLPMLKQNGIVHRTTEAIWSNEPTAFDYQQQVLFA